MSAVVTFDKASHTYTDAATGRRVPLSVTGIIKRAGLAETRFYTDEARDRGAAPDAATEDGEGGRRTEQTV